MIDLILWLTMLSNQWIPGPVLNPPRLVAPPRVLRCVGYDCHYWWPVRVGQ